METNNAVIEKAVIEINERGFLSAKIVLNYADGMSQIFGGYRLYTPKGERHHELKSLAGHFIYRVMQVAGASKWEHLVGNNIRVKSDERRVHAIGHIVNNDWLYPHADFSDKQYSTEEKENE